MEELILKISIFIANRKFFLKEYLRRKSKIENELNSFMNFLENKSLTTSVNGTNVKEIISKSIKSNKLLSSYSSKVYVMDYSKDSVSVRDDSVVEEWRADFIRPNKCHVIQKGWDKYYDYDEWVTVDDKTFLDMAIYWVLFKKLDYRDLNQDLAVDGWVKIIENESPVSSTAYIYGGIKYILLEYKLPENVNKSINYPFKNFIFIEGITSRIKVLIDIDTGLIRKGIIDSKGFYEDKWQDSQISSVFGGYNKRIKINSPTKYHIAENPDDEVVTR